MLAESIVLCSYATQELNFQELLAYLIQEILSIIVYTSQQVHQDMSGHRICTYTNEYPFTGCVSRQIPHRAFPGTPATRYVHSGVARSQTTPRHWTRLWHAPLVKFCILEVATQIVLETIFEMPLVLSWDQFKPMTSAYVRTVQVFPSIKRQTCEQ